MAYHSEYHGVRLDVYAADEKHTRYNVEMQVVRQDYLPKKADIITHNWIWMLCLPENL